MFASMYTLCPGLRYRPWKTPSGFWRVVPNYLEWWRESARLGRGHHCYLNRKRTTPDYWRKIPPLCYTGIEGIPPHKWR